MDSLSIFLQIIFLPYFIWKIRGKWGDKISPNPYISQDGLISLGNKDKLRDAIFSSSRDSHNLMCQIGHGYFHPEWAEKMAELAVDEKGSLHRFVPNGYNPPPSRDMLAAWCYFYSVCKIKRPDLIKAVAKNFLKNCLSLSSHSTPTIAMKHVETYTSSSAGSAILTG